MKTAGRIAAWTCIFSTLLMGCYSSVMIEPTGLEKEKIYSGRIKSEVTKDGTVFWFDPLAVADSTAIVGVVNGKQVSIPLSDVESVTTSSRPSNAISALLIVIGSIGLLFLLWRAINGFEFWPRSTFN